MIRLNWIGPDEDFPPATQSLTEPNGLVAATVSLSPSQVLRAYRQGIFPWYSDGQPVLWWSPDPRMVLMTDGLKISRSFAKTLRQKGRDSSWRVTTDTAFKLVISACANLRRSRQGTWITDELAQTYLALHDQGHAHSIEIWNGDTLVGGLYGLCIGRMFYGESMFSVVPEASKIALTALVDYLVQNNCRVIDCQQDTEHLTSMGGQTMPRSEFLAALDRYCVADGFNWQVGPLPFPER